MRSARFQIPGKEFLFVFLLLALIIPYQALLTPIFLQFAQMKLTNSLVGLAIIHTAIHLPFSLYIMRNSFEAVPRELEEAAVIDGANSWQLLRSIFLPAVMPAIITVSLFGFITSWNEFLGALVMMNKGEMYTLPLVLTTARTADQPRRHRLGPAAGGGDDLDHSLHRHLPPAPALLRRRASSTAPSSEFDVTPPPRAAAAGRSSASGAPTIRDVALAAGVSHRHGQQGAQRAGAAARRDARRMCATPR